MAQQQSSCDLMFVDDFYFSVLSNEEEGHQILPVSDEKYAEELQFQEIIMASLITAQVFKDPSASLSSATKHQENAESSKETTETGESSKRFCEICAERKENEEMFQVNMCSHSFCTLCVSRYVDTRIQRSKNVVIMCPGLECQSVIEIDACRSMMPQDLVSRWDAMLFESLIHDSEKFYCPFKDCSVLLDNDSEKEEVIIRESVCPSCHRLFCAKCHVPWHSGVGCEEFQSLDEDERGMEDLMVRELAKKENWMRCPNCRFIVEKTEGCLHMTCRCRFEFCYSCGATWTSNHNGCSQ